MSLLALQRDFRLWLTEASAEAASRVGASAMPGLQIYQNNYRAQLMACMEDSFPQLRAWLGDDAFRAAAAVHIDRMPPHRWTLDAYPVDFPATLADLHPGDPEIAELARLELALAEAFVGPDADPLRAEALAGIDWDRALLHFVPTLRLIAMGTNAASIWSALSGGEEPPAAMPFPSPVTVAIWRRDGVSCFRTLEDEEASAMRSIMRDGSFAALCEQFVHLHGPEAGIVRAGELLGRWIVEQCLADVEGAG